MSFATCKLQADAIFWESQRALSSEVQGAWFHRSRGLQYSGLTTAASASCRGASIACHATCSNSNHANLAHLLLGANEIHEQTGLLTTSQCNLAASSRILRGFIQHSGPLPSSIVSVLYKPQRSVFLSQLMWMLYVSVAKPSGSQHRVGARQLQVDGGCPMFPNSLPKSPSGCRIQFRVPQQNPLLCSPTEPVAVNPTYWPCVMAWQWASTRYARAVHARSVSIFIYWFRGNMKTQTRFFK